MDQHTTLKETTQMTPNVNSRDSASATSSSVDATMAHSTGYFNFFGLPREIRDMIYDQPQMLDQEIPISCHDGTFHSKTAATKPRTSLLMVSSQFSSEYEKRCEGRSGLFISRTLDKFDTIWQVGLQLPLEAAKEVSFMHIHAANWMNYEYLLGIRGFELFKRSISHYASQMPKLQNISVNLYTNRHDFQDAGIGRSFIKQLDALTSVGQLTELRVIIMEVPLYWHSRHVVKELLVHWKRGSDTPLQVMDPAVAYEEKCCDGTLSSELVEEDDDDDVEDGYLGYHGDDSEDDYHY